MTFSPTELELQIMRVLDGNPWSPPKAVAAAAGLDDVGRVRSALGELRRFHLVVSDGRLGGGAAGRYSLTGGGQSVLIDTTRRRALAAVQAELAAAA